MLCEHSTFLREQAQSRRSRRCCANTVRYCAGKHGLVARIDAVRTLCEHSTLFRALAVLRDERQAEQIGDLSRHLPDDALLYVHTEQFDGQALLAPARSP